MGTPKGKSKLHRLEAEERAEVTGDLVFESNLRVTSRNNYAGMSSKMLAS